ncbi:hypothetical protein [uncultured Algimonas sp.]|uniref:hypothetical protein n=1 Tax=uncultured Algimonas sp. TaxID=1547920 RepID=UPI00263741A0|nr:hypothetical protein [uncultured Algimonas sp.]
MKTLTLLAAAALIVLPGAALASTSTADNISACKAEIESQLDATQTDLDFKTVKGNSRVQTLSFRIEADGEKDKVTCKVRRDDTVEVVWGKTVKPAEKVLSVEADVSASAGK